MNKLNISFNEKDHIYKIKETGKTLISVTKFIDQFFPKFDVEKWSRFCVGKEKYRGMSQDDIKNEWKLKRLKSLEEGHNLHKFAENLIKEKKLPEPVSKRNEILFNHTRDLIRIFSRNYEFLDGEKIIFSPSLKLAGTLDLLMKNASNIIIVDWKQCKEIKKRNSYEKAFPPINHMDNCNFNKYALQLNFYKYILLREKYIKTNRIKMWIIHLTVEGINRYRIPDMKKEVSDLISMKINNPIFVDINFLN